MTTTATTATSLLDKLRSLFGYTEFRPLQEEAVEAILQGRDACVIMPTGGGKSLCYQLPALLSEGTTVVISPLIALMKDQVDALDRRGIPATFLNSSLDASEAARRRRAVMQGKVKLLYLAPERLVQAQTMELLSGLSVPLIAIDEAHCISQWGHDFRPEYRELGRLREMFPKAVLAAFTATATRRVEADIVSQLKLRQPTMFRGSFNRANLYYQVRAKDKAFHQVAEYCLRHEEASGIVYCLSRASTEDVAERLRDCGVQAQAYHAGLESEDRRMRQEAFLSGRTRVIVATIAFGMGIDKPNVRFVIHYDLPQNLEGFYQESGRAGRDGQPSDCILFYSYGDVRKLEYFIEQKSINEQRVARQQLREIVEWAESATCRRQRLLAYFEEHIPAHSAPDCCDVCGRREATADYTVHAQKLLSCAHRTGEAYGLGHLQLVLVGSGEKRIAEVGHDRLPTFGIGRDISRQEWRRIADHLVKSGYLRLHIEGGAYPVAKITPLGEEVLFKGRKVFMTVQAAEAMGAREAPKPLARPVLEKLNRAKLGHSPRESLRLFQEGQSVAAIAEARNIAESTVAGHLVEAMEAGETVAVERVVSADKRRDIAAVIEALGEGPLKVYKERLGEDYSYGEIRLVLAAQRQAKSSR